MLKRMLAALFLFLFIGNALYAKVIQVTPINPNVKITNPTPKVSATVVSPTLTITITVVGIPASISLPTTSFSGPPTNHGMKISNIVVGMSPATSPFTGSVTLGGTNASSFAVNGCPSACELDIGSSDLAAGNYSISLTATQ